MIKIGDFSKLSMVSIRMLRHYDSIGLLAPEKIDPITGYRYYTPAQLTTAGRIQSLKNMGFSLSAIGSILREYNDPESLKRYLLLHLVQIKEDADKIQKQVTMVESMIERLGKDGISMNYNVSVKEFAPIKVMSLRGIIPAYENEGDLWQELYRQTAGQNVQPASPPYYAAVFYDEGFKESDVDVEIQASVTGDYHDTEQVKFKMTTPITAATVVVKGDYSQMSDVCEAIANWVSDNGYAFSGPMFNIYHVGPACDKNPANWVTEVCFPVIKK